MLPKIPHQSVVTKQPLSTSVMATCFNEIQKMDLAVLSVHINARDINTLINLGPEHYDREKGSIWGAHVIEDNTIPVNTIYFCGEHVNRCVKLTFSENIDEVKNG